MVTVRSSYDKKDCQAVCDTKQCKARQDTESLKCSLSSSRIVTLMVVDFWQPSCPYLRPASIVIEQAIYKKTLVAVSLRHWLDVSLTKDQLIKYDLYRLSCLHLGWKETEVLRWLSIHEQWAWFYVQGRNTINVNGMWIVCFKGEINPGFLSDNQSLAGSRKSANLQPVMLMPHGPQEGDRWELSLETSVKTEEHSSGTQNSHRELEEPVSLHSEEFLLMFNITSNCENIINIRFYESLILYVWN